MKNIFKIFSFNKSEDNDNDNQKEFDFENQSDTQTETETQKEIESETPSINDQIEEAFKPFAELMLDMKSMLDQITEVKQDVEEQSVKLNDKINEGVIKALADRGIEQLNDTDNITKTEMSLSEQYKTNPSEFLKRIGRQ